MRMVQPPVSGLQIACELAEFGASLVEQRFRHEHPDACDDDVDAHV